MKIDWPGAARHFLQVVAFCCVVAVLTTSIWPRHSYWVQWVHALAIGLVIWCVIEFGRLLVPARYCRPSSTGGHGWPKGWRGIALTVIGIGAGFLVGDPLGAWLMGTGGNRFGPLSRHGLGDKADRWGPVFDGARAIAFGRIVLRQRRVAQQGREAATKTARGRRLRGHPRTPLQKRIDMGLSRLQRTLTLDHFRRQLDVGLTARGLDVIDDGGQAMAGRL